MGQQTALYPEHLALKARIVDFGGWDMPVQYSSVLEEHHAVRRDAGMFDVSHMTFLELEGPDAEAYLRRLLANDVARLALPGKALYSAMLKDDGGIIVDMLCHWQYVIQNLFGDIKSLSCLGATHLPQRWDEAGQPYRCTADDAAYATFELKNGIICHFNSSWCVRVDRDDLLTLQVDGTHGSAVAGLRDCKAQALAATPRCVWNPDVDSPIDFKAGWTRVPSNDTYDNAFKVEWELFLKHVVTGSPFPWSLREGAKGVQLAELGLKSWAERKWIDVPELA